MNEFEKLMQELDELCEEAWRLPLSNGKVVIDREALRARAAEYMKNAESDPDYNDWEDDTP